MSRLTSWWDALSGPEKFRLYTRVTIQVAVLSALAALSLSARGPWLTVGIVVAGLASIVALEVQPDFAGPSGAAWRRWALPAAIAALAAVWLIFGLVSRLATSDSIVKQAGIASIFAAILGMLSVVAFMPHKWWIVLGLSVTTGVVLGSAPLLALVMAAVTFVAGCFVVATTLLTAWGVRVVDELDRAKGVEAALQVAEERLRFSRDLHDIVGRGFSAIAVKSELAAVLSRSGQSDRAAVEMDEVKTLAVESMGQMRKLVRGYRGIDLMGEVGGARSLLSAVGCRLVVEGDAAKVPARFHEVAAWVVREGTTNIVEHSAATSAVLTLGDAGMSLRNDCPHGTPGKRSGLRGLGERLAAIGATLDVAASPEEFILEIHWENK